MAVSKQQAEMTQLGFYGLIPFVASAAALWLSPLVIPQHKAIDFHHLTILYGAIIVAYLAGTGAGASLNPGQKLRESFLPGQLITLVAFVAALPSGVFFMDLGAAWRHVIILVLLCYLLLRDLSAVSAGLLPKWYGALRTRLTLWASLSLILIIGRLLLWGYY